jgi:hypothetical protein
MTLAITVPVRKPVMRRLEEMAERQGRSVYTLAAEILEKGLDRAEALEAFSRSIQEQATLQVEARIRAAMKKGAAP